jgi:Sec-independent protein translocase protein TatA
MFSIVIPELLILLLIVILLFGPERVVRAIRRAGESFRRKSRTTVPQESVEAKKDKGN